MARKMEKYKVLNADLTSPFQGFKFDPGREYVCNNFDESDNECSTGFYATDVEGILYSFRPDRLVFECEVFGRSKCFDQYKQRHERFVLGRQIPETELKTILQAESERLGYNLFELCYPVHPFKIEAGPVTDHEIDLLKKWASLGTDVRINIRTSLGDSVGRSVGSSVWDSVWDSVGDSVGDSVMDSVMDSVGHSVGSFEAFTLFSRERSVRVSVWDSVWAYISSLFPNVQFSADLSPCVELWRSGFVPSFDGETWRLHAAKGIVWE